MVLEHRNRGMSVTRTHEEGLVDQNILPAAEGRPADGRAQRRGGRQEGRFLGRILNRIPGRLTRALHSRGAMAAFGGASVLESALLPIPIDLFMIPLLMANRSHFWRVVMVGTLGSVVGAIIGYAIGFIFFETIGTWIISASGLENDAVAFQGLADQYGVWVVAVAGITPLPFKVAAILSGVASMNFWAFVATCIVIRFIRFTMIGGMLLVFAPLIAILHHRYPVALYGAMTLVVIGGFFMLSFVDVDALAAIGSI